MSIQGDLAREGMAQDLCKVVADQMKQHPEAIEPLKRVGREILDQLPNLPDYLIFYAGLFQERR